MSASNNNNRRPAFLVPWMTVRHIGRDKAPVRPLIEIKLLKGWLMIFYTHRPVACWSDDGSIPHKGYNNGRWIIGNWWHYWKPF